MFRFYLLTLGCKTNQYESAALTAALKLREGQPLETADRPGAASHDADIVVINTCCVTESAMQKSRYLIRRSMARHGQAVFLITGCYSDLDRQRLERMFLSQGLSPGRFVIAGHHDHLSAAIDEVLEKLARRRPGAPRDPDRAKESQDLLYNNDATSLRTPQSIRRRRQDAINHNALGTSDLPPIGTFAGHQRAFVKVQDGCDAFCAYCIVPYTRPRVWSRSMEEILRECRQLVSAGHREIVLSGVFLGAFGRTSAIRRRWEGAASALPQLVREVGQIEGLWKVRLSSLEPLDADDALLDACAQTPCFAPHFHLPLQSGSGRILKRMNRQYTPEQFRGAIERIRSRFERPALTADVIMGFPGETDEDFAQTMEMAGWAGFSKIHIFPFSAIEGTAAWTYRQQAPRLEVVRERTARLADVARATSLAYSRQFVGEMVQAVVEECDAGTDHEAGDSSASSVVEPVAEAREPLVAVEPVAEAREPLFAGVLPTGIRRQAMTDRHLLVSFDGDMPAGRIVRLNISAADSEGLSGTLG